jgi:outer membrane protein assembly factor BamE (lipoprotein component of BamABCDE complex)
MDYRMLLIAAVLGTGLAGLADSSRADMIATDNGIAVKQSDVAIPSRGMTMDQVASKFGAPVTKVPAVGKPPISRWEYPGFVVYFEHEHVIHSVVGTPPATGDAPAPAPST